MRSALATSWAPMRAIAAPFAGLLLALGWPAAAAPSVSAEIAFSAPVSGPAAEQQHSPALATGNGAFLAIWVDERKDQSSEIYGARLGPTGKLLDPAALKLSNSARYISAPPSVAFDGTNYLVAYQHFASSLGPGNAVVQRVSSTGALLDPAPIPLLADTEQQRSPRIAFDGTNYLVVFSSLALKAVRVSPQGQVLDPNGITLSGMTGSDFEVAFNGTDYVVVANQKLVRVTPAGVVRDATPLTHSGAVGAFACEAGTCLLAYASGSKVQGIRLGANGQQLDAMPIALLTLPTTQSVFDVALAYGGGRYTVAVLEGSNSVAGKTVRTQRLLPSLTADGASAEVWSTPNEIAEVKVASLGTSSLVAWPGYKQFQENRAEILGARLSAQGALQDATPVLLSVGAATQKHPVAAFGGTHSLAVWCETREGTQEDIYATRVSADGVVLDSPAIGVATTVDIEREPAVAYGGGVYLVAWGTWSSGLWARRLDASGTPLGSAVQLANAVTASKNRPAVAFDGTNFRVVWEFGSNHLQTRRVSPSGTIVDPMPLTVFNGGRYVLTPAIGCDGTNCLVAWSEQPVLASTDVVRAVRLGPANTPIEAMPFTVAMGEQVSGVQPAVAFDGTNYTVSYNVSAFKAVRVSKAGAVLDATPKTLTTDTSAYGGTLSWDGQRYVAGWSRWISWSSSELYARGFDASLTPIDATPALLTSSVARRDEVALSAFAPGKVMVLYSTFDEGDQFHAWRARAKLVVQGAASVGCTAAADCPSGYCVDGFCCDRACGGNDQHDCQACSSAAGALFNGVCATVPSGRQCRASASSCDPVEQCDGTSPFCPADVSGPAMCPADAGVTDGGSADAGPPDAGATDAGPRDAGSVDAGHADESGPDAGAPTEGAPDGGAPMTEVIGTGCSCGSGADAWSHVAAALLLAISRWRRRGPRQGTPREALNQKTKGLTHLGHPL